MLKQLQMGLRAFVLLASKFWSCLIFLFKKQVRVIAQHQAVKYEIFPLSPLSRHRLSIVKRKVLVLDLDETLIHSHHDGITRPTVKPGTPPDFVLKVTIDRHPVRFFVHKRPHVDFFLDISWFSDPSDTALLALLPVLDALRFTQDVRSVLSRNLHMHRLW
ncbi:hypothetical protein M8J76_004488 [Diaphorina citri]|nr:hypothetical protein M8J76_004488 [Diaphorina citri]